MTWIIVGLTGLVCVWVIARWVVWACEIADLRE